MGMSPTASMNCNRGASTVFNTVRTIGTSSMCCCNCGASTGMSPIASTNCSRGASTGNLATSTRPRQTLARRQCLPYAPLAQRQRLRRRTSHRPRAHPVSLTSTTSVADRRPRAHPIGPPVSPAPTTSRLHATEGATYSFTGAHLPTMRRHVPPVSNTSSCSFFSSPPRPPSP